MNLLQVFGGMYVNDWSQSTTFKAKYEYIYDGAKFYIGCKNSERNLTMIEHTTLAFAVTSSDGTFKKPQEVIERFRQKLLAPANKGRNIHEVIRDCMNNNIEAELCLVNLLII